MSPQPRADQLRLERAFIECPGKWVALDRRTGAVLRVADSPYDLAAKMRRDGVTGADIIRTPDVEDLEVVGFG